VSGQPLKAAAGQFAANVLSVIRDLQQADITSHNRIATALNGRGVRTPRRERWMHVQVGMILKRAVEAESLRGLEIEGGVIVRGSPHGNVAGLGAAGNLVDEDRNVAEHVDEADAVAHQRAGFHPRPTPRRDILAFIEGFY
jgi:hypothetical protein